jgi:hypothetical protein
MKRLYTTRSLWLAAYCVLLGIEVADVIPEADGKNAIVLDNTDDRAWLAAHDWYQDDPKVPIRAYLEARATLTKRINEMREGVAA